VTTSYAVREPRRTPVDATETATAEFFAALQDNGGPAQTDRLRARIVELNLPFATRLAHRYRNRGQADEDLAQVAALALVKAVNGFDSGMGKPFFAYLIPTVLGELRKHFRDTGWAVHVDRGLQERHLELARARTSLAQRLQRPPTVEDLAADLNIEPAEVLEAWAAGNAYDHDSLNAGVTAGDDGAERLDFLGGDDPDLISISDRLALRELVRRLPGREHYIVTRYFFGDATQQQIAEELGMSQMNVSRLLRRTLQSLRQQLNGDGDDLPAPAGTAAISAHVAQGRVLVAVRGEVDDRAAAQLRDVLVDTVVRERPQRIVVDLVGLGAAGGRLVRALVDAYRAGGHSGTTIAAINVPADLFAVLSRLGVTRLFPCRAAPRTTGMHNSEATFPGDGRTSLADGPIDTQADPGGGSHPLGVGWRRAPRRASDPLRIRRPADEELADCRPGRDHCRRLVAGGLGGRCGGRHPARGHCRRTGPGRASMAHRGVHRCRHCRHPGRDGLLASAQRSPPVLTAGRPLHGGRCRADAALTSARWLRLWGRLPRNSHGHQPVARHSRPGAAAWTGGPRPFGGWAAG
jgi:RNA polymerase sigma-B factor